MRNLIIPTLVILSLSSPSAIADWAASAEEVVPDHPTWIFTPSAPLPNSKHGLLIVLHGCAQSHDDLKQFGNLEGAANSNGLVAAVPSVGSHPWPGSPDVKCWDYDGAADGSHHASDIIRLTQTLISRAALNIDPTQVFITGLSSGGALSLVIGCKAPDLFAGVGAIAGPSVGSSQSEATAFVPNTNVANATAKCRALAGDKAPSLATQVANIAYGDMDLDGPDAEFRYTPGDTNHPGQYALVSINWSKDNIRILQTIYGTGTLTPAVNVQNGLGDEQDSAANGQIQLGELVAAKVGHAWPAGSGRPNNVSTGGLWIAQSGLSYAEYIAGWFGRNNLRANAPQITLNLPAVSGMTFTETGRVADATVIARVDTALLRADPSGSFQQIASHQLSPAPGDFSDTYDNLSDGWYKMTVTVSNGANRKSSRSGEQVAVGNPPPLWQCKAFIASNFSHVQAARAHDQGGIAYANGSNAKMGLDNIFFVTTLGETKQDYYIPGGCP